MNPKQKKKKKTQRVYSIPYEIRRTRTYGTMFDFSDFTPTNTATKKGLLRIVPRLLEGQMLRFRIDTAEFVIYPESDKYGGHNLNMGIPDELDLTWGHCSLRHVRELIGNPRREI